MVLGQVTRRARHARQRQEHKMPRRTHALKTWQASHARREPVRIFASREDYDNGIVTRTIGRSRATTTTTTRAPAAPTPARYVPPTLRTNAINWDE